ncbi:hypothetical protein COU61_01750 [Candidatus Pacearchaeota archaeon CG10_big_fil_rev_8_21_14_0_10_35_13]|nr:MAG: hypothetical protein COU61_01750 [Candidatus Pacearchaeota archaeon CG10_big_fil_rev_8_21_14_0_10_35_13]
MKRKIIRIISAALIVIGIGTLIIPESTITGNVVIEVMVQEHLRVFGVIMLLAGIVGLIVSGEDRRNRSLVNYVIKEYENGKLNPVQAVTKINEELFPNGLRIDGVRYHGRNNVSIRTSEGIFTAHLSDTDKARELALAAYETALINNRGDKRNCELHISKEVSTKHHVKGFEELLSDFRNKYSRESRTSNT